MFKETIAENAKKFGIKPLKKYGQNFIFDSSLCDKITKAAGNLNGKRVLEVGPGTCGLTRSIIAQDPSVIALVEVDSRVFSLLDDLVSNYRNIELFKQDALLFDINKVGNKENKVSIVSNLPYNIGTELIIRWLRTPEVISNMVLMLQKEVVERMVAQPNSKTYGRLSVYCQVLCTVEKMFDVSNKAFYPPPKVTSSIVKLTPKSNVPSREVMQILEKITLQAFNHRRKMIGSYLITGNSRLKTICEKLSIKLTSRAENITPLQYLNIAEMLYT